LILNVFMVLRVCRGELLARPYVVNLLLSRCQLALEDFCESWHLPHRNSGYRKDRD